MVVDSSLSLLYLYASNASQSDFKMLYHSLRHTVESSNSHRYKIGLVWFSDWVQPVHRYCHRIIVFVIDVIDCCRHK